MIIVSVFIIGRLDFYIIENLEFDYNDITLSFDTYKDTYLINRIVEQNFSDQIEDDPITTETTVESLIVENATNDNQRQDNNQIDFNYTYQMPDIFDDTVLIDKLRANYYAYLIYFFLDLINNMIIFYSLERKHYKTLFFFQLVDILWILICQTVKFYCCLIESQLYKVIVIFVIAIFIFIDFLI